jgi:hypothetical protein
MSTPNRSRRTTRRTANAHGDPHDPSLVDIEERPQPSQDQIDESLEESFPASDPPSWVAVARIGPPKRKLDK